GTGADIVVRPPDSSIFSFSGIVMSEKIVDVVRQQPRVTLATGSLIQSVGPLDSIAGIHLDEFNAMSGGFTYLEGGPFRGQDDVVLDEVEARGDHAHAGSKLVKGRTWNVTGVVEAGKMSGMVG